MSSPQFTLKSEMLQVGKLEIRQLQPRLPSSNWPSAIYHLPGLICVPLQIVFVHSHAGHAATLTRPTAASRSAHRSNTWNATCFPALNSKTSEVSGMHGEQEMDSSVSRLKASLSSLRRPPPPSPLSHTSLTPPGV